MVRAFIACCSIAALLFIAHKDTLASETVFLRGCTERRATAQATRKGCYQRMKRRRGSRIKILLVAGAVFAVSRVSRKTWTRLAVKTAQTLDWRFGWHRLPLPLGLASLVVMRMQLRQDNLRDTGSGTQVAAAAAGPGRYRFVRSPDGTYNDLESPSMGAAGTRFGRNVPVAKTYREDERAMLTPNPRTVSRELLTRHAFLPATTLNLLAAAWLQFMVHDWLSHGKNEKENPWVLPLLAGDPWPEPTMRILRTRQDPSRPRHDDGAPPTYVNTATHWWDGSQIYGSDAETLKTLRSGRDGKLQITEHDRLPENPRTHTDRTGVTGNYWVGLSLLHTLFSLEHNAICDHFKALYPSWSDDELFDHARLVNAALMAKIHTVEWTPGILGSPTMQIAMRGNWWGAAMDQTYRLFGRISKSEVISGIPGSIKNHDGVPYAITEEFVAVYRMHPLLPDELVFRSLGDDHEIERFSFPDVAFRKARGVLDRIGMLDAFYSFGTSHPGAITLHNFPSTLQQFEEPPSSSMSPGDKPVLNDLAAIDILRVRERGVPRYNEFRRLMHRPPVKSFEELTDNPQWAAELKRVYEGDINRVDLMVGLYAEPLPEGFGFSDTAFRIFILMASRRLRSDRFFTTDYTPAVYTQAGLDWIENNDMSSVLLRHHPLLAPALRGVKNAFAPWKNVRS